MTDFSVDRRELLKFAGTGALGATVSMPGMASAQTSAVTVDVRQINRPDFPFVSVFASIRDQNGNPISGLDSGDISVAEDGSPQTIESIATPSTDRAEDVSVSLVIDRSTSMDDGTKIQDARAAAKQFVDELKADDEAQVIDFGSDVTFAERWTKDKSDLKSAIDSIFTSGRTALWDAAYEAIQQAEPRIGRSAVILLTDGQENESSRSKAAVIDAGNANNVPVYTIGLGSGVDESALQDVARQTGGTYDFAPTSADLADIYRQISQGISDEYRLRYRTSNTATDGSIRSVEVTADVGGATDSDSATYEAPCAPLPDAAFTLEPNNPVVGQEVAFDGSPSTANGGSLVAYRWDFDNNGVTDATGKTATHTYTAGGSYEARLTVEKTCGATDVVVVSLDVSVASFLLSIRDVNDPITAGDTLHIDLEVENRDTETRAETIVLQDFDGETVKTKPVQVGSGRSKTVSIEWETGPGDAGSGDITLQVANYAVSRDVVIGESAGFDPARHGFEFRNWSTGSNRFQPPHDHANLSKSEIRDVIENTWKDKLVAQGVLEAAAGNPLAVEALVLFVYTLVNQGTGTNGHCFGMVFAAKEYYERPSEIPVSASTASQIPKPTGQYSTVGDDIDFYHNTQTMDLSTWASLQSLFNRDQEIEYGRVVEELKAGIDEVGTAPVGMAGDIDDDGEIEGHQVLAYDYVESGDTVAFKIYNPNFGNVSSFADIEFNTSGATSPVTDDNGDIYPGYDRVGYIPTANIDVLGAIFPGALFSLKGLWTSMVTFVTRSPITITVTDPNGEELDAISAEYRSEAPTEYEDVRYRFDAPPGDYTVEIEGDDDGDYTVEAKGQTADGGTIDDSVSGTITKGETRTVSATVPEDDRSEGRFEGGGSGGGVWYSDYVNANGVVDTAGLNRAVTDYLTGDLTASRFNSVVTSYLAGTPLGT